MITQTIRVRVGSYVTPPVIHAVQNDTGRVLVFELADFTLASGDTAYMLCKRPSGTLFSYTGTIGANNRTVSVEMNIDGGALTQVGNVDVQIAIIRGNLIVKTFKAIIAVEPDLSGASTPEEQSTIDEILHQIDELWEAIEGGGSSPVWGNITGTIADQTDLQNALNAKIAAPSSPATGQFLSWNGSAWVAASLPVYNGGVN